MLFPLPLAPFELLMLRDDVRSEYPMWFEIATDVSGAIDRLQFEEAVRIVMERHPLISAQVAEIDGCPHWTAAKSPARAVFWALDENTAAVDDFYRRVSLKDTSGFRVLIHRHKEFTQIIWRFHHASTDGVGACVVIGDALAIYHGLVTQTEWQSKLKELEPNRLAERTAYRPNRVSRAAVTSPVVKTATPPGLQVRIQRLLRPVSEAIHLLTLSPLPIAAGAEHSNTNLSRSLLTQKFSRQETMKIHDLSQSMNVTVNDLLIAGFYRAIFRWNDERAGQSSRGFVRITMPTNLRTSADKKMPAANRMSYAFLDRSRKEIEDWPSLVRGINYASRAIIRENLSLQFLKTLAIFARWPSLIRFFILGRGCFSSAVLSNLGDPSRRFEASLSRVNGKIVSGDLTLESIYAAPPVRPKTSMAIAVCHYDDCLTFGAMIDQKTLNIAEGYVLLQRIYEEILSAAATIKMAAS